jgi:hypothetical protein
MKAFLFIIMYIILAAAVPAGAEFYRFIDDQGRTRYTDDINQVPAAQRARVTSYAGTNSSTGQTQSAAETQATPPAGDTIGKAVSATPADTGSGPDGAADLSLARIEEMRKQLDTEFQAIAKEKEALAKAKEASKSREEIMAYNKKVEAFNLRAEQFEKQGVEFKRFVHEYNTRLVEEGGKDLNSIKK